MAENNNKPIQRPGARPTPAPTARPATAGARPAATSAARPATTATRTATVPTTKPATAGARPTATSAAKPATTATRTATAPTTKPAATVKTASAKSAVSAKQSAAKTAKKTKSNQNAGSGFASIKEKVVAIVQTRNFKLGGIVVLAALLLLGIILGVVFGVKGCSANLGGALDFPDFGELTVTAIEGSHNNKTQVGYSGEIIGTAERYKPVDGVHNEGLSSKGYPEYGKTLNLTTDEKKEILSENGKLIANDSANGTYALMDKDGYLYKKQKDDAGNYLKPGEGVPERLYKHTAAVGLYGGDVSDSEPAVVKSLTFRPRSYSSYYNVTGLYAPAGEVIKIQLTDADMTATGGIVIHIGQALYNGQANNIWAQRAFNRMPVILNTMNVTKETASYDEDTGLWTGYVGSFFGGPIYVRSESCTFSVTVSGGVNYPHFILGVTTEEEYTAYLKSSAPYFDLEVWDRGVLHSGPRSAARRFSYNDLYKAAVLWEKIALVTTSVSNQGIVFIYDPFVAAGAAVAFPGRRSVNCPTGWMTDALNYDSFVTSGSWGNLHEYHHNFQDYGTGDTGEVTNNGLNLVSYSLFTKISSARQIESYGGAGLSGWNQYTSATWAAQRVNNGAITGTNGLAVYATLLHNFGQDVYIKARGTRNAAYFNRYAALTHQDFSYFTSKIASYSNVTPAQTDYPLFVPVSSVYQTGRTYNYDGEKREITTMQPYVIPYGQTFTLDLNPYTTESGQYRSGSVVIGDGFRYKIKDVKADGVNGTLRTTDREGVYSFTPGAELRSGKIYVTLEITTSDGAKQWNGHSLDDVDLIIEFQQSHESNKTVLERTTYFYNAETAYSDAREAFEKGYAGYESKNERNHSNPTQNCNTDIWYCTQNTISKFPKANPELDIVKPYSIDELCGKLYFTEAGTYNIYLRGRKNCAVYYSIDGGKNYSLGTYIADDSTSAEWRVDKYFTLELDAESWVYFKEVLINEQISGSTAGFIGLGIGQWTTPLYNQVLDSNGDVVLDGDGNPKYVDANGREVSAEEASDSSLRPPTTISYATAYRQYYEFQKAFESDYFYTRTYTYDYKDNVCVPKNEVTVTETNYTATGWGAGMPITNISDGKTNTYIHTSWGVTEKKPLNLTLDLGGERTVNRITFYCRNNNGQLETPKTFTVEGSLDGTEWFDVAAYDNAPRNGNRVTVDFADTVMNYCRIVISQAHQSDYYIVIGEIEMWNVNEINGATEYSPDDVMFAYKGNWRIAQTNASFGHVYLADSGCEVSFDYEAKDDNGMFGILSSNKYGSNFEVYIDGEKAEVEMLDDSLNDVKLVLSQKLSQGTHNVTVKCVGEANIDAIVFY